MKSKNPDDTDEIAVIGVDIGKDTFHLVGFDQSGQRVLRKKIKRLALKPTKIRQTKQLQDIINKAREIGAQDK